MNWAWTPRFELIESPLRLRSLCVSRCGDDASASRRRLLLGVRSKLEFHRLHYY